MGKAEDMKTKGIEVRIGMIRPTVRTRTGWASRMRGKIFSRGTRAVHISGVIMARMAAE